MTLGEIQMYIEEKGKEVLINNYNLANLISVFVGNALNGKQNPSLETLYPQIFHPVEEDNVKATAFLKDQWITFAEHHNKKRRKKEGDDLLTLKNS